VFQSPASFADFIAQGVTSYGLSRYPGRLTVLNLRKTDNAYAPLAVDELDGPIFRDWLAAGGVLDSALRTAGGAYEWTYRGLTVPAQAPEKAGSAATGDGRGDRG
jgi:hypothetical protein